MGSRGQHGGQHRRLYLLTHLDQGGIALANTLSAGTDCSHGFDGRTHSRGLDDEALASILRSLVYGRHGGSRVALQFFKTSTLTGFTSLVFPYM